MQVYLYDSDFFFTKTAQKGKGVTYPNSTETPVNWEGRDKNIFRAKFDKANNAWTFEYKPEYLEKMEKESGLTLKTIDSMTAQELKSGGGMEQIPLEIKPRRGRK